MRKVTIAPIADKLGINCEEFKAHFKDIVVTNVIDKKQDVTKEQYLEALSILSKTHDFAMKRQISAMKITEIANKTGLTVRNVRMVFDEIIDIYNDLEANK